MIGFASGFGWLRLDAKPWSQPATRALSRTIEAVPAPADALRDGRRRRPRPRRPATRHVCGYVFAKSFSVRARRRQTDGPNESSHAPKRAAVHTRRRSRPWLHPLCLRAWAGNFQSGIARLQIFAWVWSHASTCGIIASASAMTRCETSWRSRLLNVRQRQASARNVVIRARCVAAGGRHTPTAV